MFHCDSCCFRYFWSTKYYNGNLKPSCGSFLIWGCQTASTLYICGDRPIGSLLMSRNHALRFSCSHLPLVLSASGISWIPRGDLTLKLFAKVDFKRIECFLIHLGHGRHEEDGHSTLLTRMWCTWNSVRKAAGAQDGGTTKGKMEIRDPKWTHGFLSIHRVWEPTISTMY